jgi:hypothetical protein
MIQPQTCLRVADNSGAKNLMCIRILGSNRRYGHVGDVIIGVVKDATPNLTVKRSDVVRVALQPRDLPRTGSNLLRQLALHSPPSHEWKIESFTWQAPWLSPAEHVPRSE